MKFVIRAFACAACFLAIAVASMAVARAQSAPSPSPAPALNRCGSILFIGSEQNKTESPCTVFTGQFDFEMDYANTTYTGAFVGNDAVVPQAYLRLGTTNPDFDLEIGFPSYERVTNGFFAAGSTDVSLAAKYQLASTSSHEYAVRSQLTLPTGSKGITSGNAQFYEAFDWSFPVGTRYSISGTLSFNALSEEYGAKAQSYFQFEPSVLIGYAIPGRPAELSAEYVYDTSYGPGLGDYSTVDFNYRRTFGANLQVEIEYGFTPSLPTSQRSHYVDLGFSFLNKD